MKKILGVLLSVCMFVSMFPATTFAKEENAQPDMQLENVEENVDNTTKEETEEGKTTQKEDVSELSQTSEEEIATQIKADTEAEDEEEIATQGTETDEEALAKMESELEQIAERFYSKQETEKVEWNKLMYDTFSSALSLVPCDGVPKKITDWAGKQLLSQLLGVESEDRTDEILSAINEVNQMNQMELLQLSELKTVVQEQEFLAAIEKYFNGDNDLFVRVKMHMGILQETEGMTPEEIEEVRQKELIWSIGKSNYDVELLEQSECSEYDLQVMKYGERLKNVVTITSGSYNALDLMNEYCLGHFKWEHHGYEMREKYWSSLVNLYVQAADIMDLSLDARIQYYEENTGKRAVTLRKKKTNLMDLTKEIKELGDKSSVVRRSDDVRYYQVQGHEMLVYTVVPKQEFPKSTSMFRDRWLEYRCPDGRKTNKFWEPFYMKDGVEGLPAEKYRQIYEDYNPKGSTEHVSLYDIFFKEENAGMTAPKDSGEDWVFISNDIKTTYKRVKTWMDLSEYWNILCEMLRADNCERLTWKDRDCNYGEKLYDGKYTLVSHFTDARERRENDISDYYKARLMMVVPVPTGNENPGQGNGQEETYLEDMTSENPEVKNTDTVGKGTTAGTTSDKTAKKATAATNTVQSTKKNAPKTGDDNWNIAWMAILGMSGVFIMGCLYKRKKQ